MKKPIEPKKYKASVETYGLSLCESVGDIIDRLRNYTSNTQVDIYSDCDDYIMIDIYIRKTI